MITIKYSKPSKLKNVKQSAYVYFEYDRYIVDVIRSIYPRYYDALNKVWEIPYDYVPYLQDNIKNEEFSVVGKPINEKTYKKKTVKDYTLPKTLKTTLYDYQKDVFNEGMTYDKYMLLLEPGLGKAQPLYSKVLTPNGFKNMGDITTEDSVIGEDGSSHRVLGVFPQGKKRVYELTFSDGSKCRCSDEHLWTFRLQNCKGRIKTFTTSELLNSPLFNESYYKQENKYHKTWKYYLPKVAPINFNACDVLIDPWLLGMLLGGGSFRYQISLSLYEKDLKEKVEQKIHKYGCALSSCKDELGDFNIIGLHGENTILTYIRQFGLYMHKSEDKFIPDIYKYNSIEIRLAILRGLIDSGGHIPKGTSYITYSTSSKQLAEDIVFLVHSLGGTCKCVEHTTFYTYGGVKKQGLNNFELYIKLFSNMLSATSEKHLKNYSNMRRTSIYRNLRNIEYIGEEECQCIYIDSDTHLYLTDDFIPTHNTVVTASIVKKRKELNHITNCLVIVCVSGLKYTWESEIKKHFGDGSVVLGNRKNTKGFYEVKSNKDKLVDIKTIKTDNDNYIYITNIESLRDKKILEELKKLFKNGTLNCLVVDECHKVKSTSSIQGKALISLSKYTKYMYELTGTIITNSPIDLYLHLKCMGIEKNTLRSFKMHYCIMGGFNNYQIVGYKHLDELQHKLNQVSIRLRKSDVLSLPDKVFIDEYVDMSTKQLKIYNDVKLAISQDIDNIALSLNPLSQLTRLRQATADTSILSSNVSESAKFVRAKELIADIVANGNSVIVFSEFTTVIDNFYCELLKDYKKVAKVTGKTKDRENQIKLFTNDKDCSIILGTEALQTGYTLTKATTVIFLDEPWSASQRLQATDRIHRIGQNSSVNIITLMCKNSIDEYVHQIVLKKEALSDALVDKKYDIHDKNVLNFLITGEGVID